MTAHSRRWETGFGQPTVTSGTGTTRLRRFPTGRRIRCGRGRLGVSGVRCPPAAPATSGRVAPGRGRSDGPGDDGPAGCPVIRSSQPDSAAHTVTRGTCVSPRLRRTATAQGGLPADTSSGPVSRRKLGGEPPAGRISGSRTPVHGYGRRSAKHTDSRHSVSPDRLGCAPGRTARHGPPPVLPPISPAHAWAHAAVDAALRPRRRGPPGPARAAARAPSRGRG